ncbi:hypothetical protein N7462_002837 [Penicillium macrosclerotiorum]|uniref:uncharacterized protein n=1 Tax=Penicillium macrosclerotiorum TaxID=303699 RepID=UPI0025476F9C|nr:uncharacterized protein N7462_002837 [Penicillium macrosclerotiorum]KAJ5693414.1 hypothetical protein N7462_002837 [Penicillium macrosclerotiorum]
MSTRTHHYRKRMRLSFACNYCRFKKTRCDEEQPCRNCRLAGIECVTTDKRRDGAVVAHRRRAVATSPSQSTIPRTPESHISIAAASVTQDRPRLWSQCWRREGWRTGRLPLMPRFVGTSTVDLMTEWLNMAFFRLERPHIHAVTPVANPHFASAIPETAPALPPYKKVEECMGSFTSTFGQAFPFLSECTRCLLSEVDLSHSAITPFSQIANAPQTALVYLIVTAGLMNEHTSESSHALISSYLAYCNSLLGHVVAARCITSVQVVFLFAVVLRSCDRIAWAWDILTMSVSMAQSLGLNESRSPLQGPGASQSLHSRIWWSIYVFEKTLAFELGRPSLVWDRNLSGILTSSVQIDILDTSECRFWQASISLANMLHEMQERSAKAWRREELLPQSVDQAIEEKIRTGEELHDLLAEWHQSLPFEYRSGSSSTPQFGGFTFHAFLSYYYNLGLAALFIISLSYRHLQRENRLLTYTNRIILVNRSTLLVDSKELREKVTKYASEESSHTRLLSGPTMVVEAARNMIKLFVPLVDSGVPDYLTTMASPISAVYALLVSILREPSSLLVRSDFELMKAGIEITKQQYQRHGTVVNIVDILLDLELYIGNLLERPLSHDSGQLSLYSPNAMLNESMTEESHSTMSLAPPWGPSVLDWAGWDWNDLSHLFQHSE